MAVTVHELEKAMTELGAVFDALRAQIDDDRNQEMQAVAQLDDDPDQEMQNAGNRLGDLDSAIEAYQRLQDLSNDLGQIRPHLKDIMYLLEYIPSEGNYGSVKDRIIAICTRTLAELGEEPAGAAQNPDNGVAMSVHEFEKAISDLGSAIHDLKAQLASDPNPDATKVAVNNVDDRYEELRAVSEGLRKNIFDGLLSMRSIVVETEFSDYDAHKFRLCKICSHALGKLGGYVWFVHVNEPDDDGGHDAPLSVNNGDVHAD